MLGTKPILTLAKSLQDSLTEGLQRIKIILQTSKQLFSDHNNSGDERTLPLFFDGRTFLLQEQSAVSPTNNTPTSQNEDSNTVKTGEVSNDINNLVLHQFLSV